MFDFKNKLAGFILCVFIVKLGHQLDIFTTLCIIGDNLFVESNIEAKKKGHMKAMKDDMGNVYVQVFVYRSNLKHILNEYIDNCIESCIVVHVLIKLVIHAPAFVPFVIMDACFPHLFLFHLVPSFPLPSNLYIDVVDGNPTKDLSMAHSPWLSLSMIHLSWDICCCAFYCPPPPFIMALVICYQILACIVEGILMTHSILWQNHIKMVHLATYIYNFPNFMY